MTIQQAQDHINDLWAAMRALSLQFPCEECEGSGDENFRGGMASPCRECWGTGVLIPKEGEEDE
jgi:DnaJ-class molecular chaperone